MVWQPGPRRLERLHLPWVALPASLPRPGPEPGLSQPKHALSSMVSVLVIVIYLLRELPSRLLCTILVPSPTRLVKPFSHPPPKTAHVHRLPVQCTDPWLANTLLHGRVYNAQPTNTNIIATTTTTITTTLTPLPQQLTPNIQPSLQ